MPYLCTQIDRESRKQQRDRDAWADSLRDDVWKKRVWREMHTKDAKRMRCTIRGFSVPLGALVRKHRGGIRVNQETLSQLRAGPTLSSAHPGKSFSSDSAHKQRKPFLPRDGRWINCIMLSQGLLFQVCRGEKKRNERQCICSQLWVFSSEAGYQLTWKEDLSVSKHSI